MNELFCLNRELIVVCVLYGCLGYIMCEVVFEAFRKLSAKPRMIYISIDIAVFGYLFIVMGEGYTYAAVTGFFFYLLFHVITDLLSRIKFKKSSERLND